MRVGGYTSVHSTCIQYQLRDLLAGFAALGHETAACHENTVWNDYEEYMGDETLWRFIEEWKPDVMLQIDGNRFHHPPLGPDLAWVNVAADRMPWLFDAATNAKWGPKDLTVACFQSLQNELLGAGQKDVRYLPIGYNADLFNRQPAAPNDRFDVDLAFVGNLPLGTECRLTRISARWAALEPALMLARQAGHRLGLYGAGWDQWKETAPYARGPVENGPDLKALYQQARLHMHVNEDMVVHMRPLECLASGGRVAIYRPATRWADPGLPDVPRYSTSVDLECILMGPQAAPQEDIAPAHSTRARALQIILWMEEKGAICPGKALTTSSTPAS